ncbi:MAG: ABC transporter permease [Dehalococcoidia bacterium]
MNTKLPGTLRLGWERTKLELRVFVRTPEQVFFTFTLPVLFLFVFASVFQGTIDGGDAREISFVQYFLPGVIASGVMSTTFGNLAIAIAIEQHDGLLKRLAGTPLPKTSFFIGKLLTAVTLTVVQTAIMLTVAVVLYDADLPADAARWGTFVAVLGMSAAVGAALGIAYTRAIPNSSSAAAIVQPPFLILQFISGVFFRYSEIPGWLQAIASVFPLRWMAEGFRYALLPDWFGEFEYDDGTWGWQWPVAVLAFWLVLAFALALLLFRWDRQRER